MDKRYAHYVWTKVRPIRPLYFLLAGIVFLVIGVMALRGNDLQMVTLRSAVYDADKNNSGVVLALQNLQVYVTSHMNTELSTGSDAPYPPIQLQYTYDRAVLAAGQAATAANSQIYTDAQHYCERLDPTDFSGRNRVPCVQLYIQNHGVKLPTIPHSLYNVDFSSPSWSPDLAGWSLLLAALSLLAAASLLVVAFWLRRAGSLN